GEPAGEVVAGVHRDLGRGVGAEVRVERDEALDLVEGPARLARERLQLLARQPPQPRLDRVQLRDQARSRELPGPRLDAWHLRRRHQPGSDRRLACRLPYTVQKRKVGASAAPGARTHSRVGDQSSDLLLSFRPAAIMSITDVSASVVTSPISRFSATSRNRRRMILPERVFGSSSTTMIWRGFAIGPISFATCSRSALMASAPDASSLATLPRRMTNATMPCPVVGSDAPTTAASATVGWLTSADSTSVVEMRWPDTFITSSTRPSSQNAPSSSYLAPSPAK